MCIRDRLYTAEFGAVKDTYNYQSNEIALSETIQDIIGIAIPAPAFHNYLSRFIGIGENLFPIFIGRFGYGELSCRIISMQVFLLSLMFML